MDLTSNIKKNIRIVPNFPKPGISFKDITPIFHDSRLVKDCVKELAKPYIGKGITKVIGIESRGFILGPMIASELNCAFVMVRKKGKLPHETIAVSYELEYGSATIEVQKDAIIPGDFVVIHDDLIATGGTAAAAAELVSVSKANLAGFSFIVQLSHLPGCDNLKEFGAAIHSLVSFND